MEGNWDFYLAQINDRPASVFLNLDLIDKCPQQARPMLLRVAVWMREPREDGLSSSAEYESLVEMEDLLAPAIGVACAAVFVGRVTTAGFRDFCFYAPASEGLEAVATSALKDLAGYRYRVSSQLDAGWEFYREFLYPSALQRQFMLNQRLLENFRQEGDGLAQVRDVDHVLYFSTAASRIAFLERAFAAGYRQLGPMLEGRGERPFGVNIVRRDSPELSKINAVTAQLFTWAEEVGGEYDGWGAEIEKG